MKKQILFIMNNLNCGGAEKALISLLETIDYSIYEVDLLLFKKEGIFLSKVPKQVNLLDEPKEFIFFDMPIKKAIKKGFLMGRIDIVINRVGAGFIYKKERNSARCEQRVWKRIRKTLMPLEKNYDAAIGYLEKNPVYFCIEMVKAKKKIGFIHNDYEKLGMDSNIDKNYFDKLDHLITVSNECANVLKKNFPLFINKIEVMQNIVSPAVIKKLSLEEAVKKDSNVHIVSVGRLNYQKGFEFAIHACKTLSTEGHRLRWDIIGEGEERETLERLINEAGLKGTINLLGIKENPYPYIRRADIYVQPSRFEGKSIAVDEAKILQKPIIVTNFSTAKDQINDGFNGLIVDMNGDSIAEGIKKLIENPDIGKKLGLNLSKEKLGTEMEIQKFYRFISAI
ncbi:glycosyltransferase [Metabacillus sp. GX 13764]|uniref:glycosyltransferase n=1 Tax=Metabacillus kandeliae TaxID=2900151 RepID=UPI001E562D06|nr:glycosyltransferase [Metabacillus kandeliae]MCD7033152.1 glycosyltransferase [Metabacillus kandeliae]